MEALIHTLFESDFYRILDFKCRCTDCTTSKPEYADSFCISFIRKGNFLFNVFRNSFDSHTGRVLITKPGYEHTVTHVHEVPDECTIFEFTQAFYQQLFEHYKSSPLDFFGNPDVHSVMLKTEVDIEYLHHAALVACMKHHASRIELDTIVMDLIGSTMKNLSSVDEGKRIKDDLKRNHLSTIEKAKLYFVSHLSENISLKDIADHCCVSMFHFSRIFKMFTSYSPNKFLINLRLKNAEVLLQNTTLPVTQICFSSGFNSLEYFSFAFNQKYGIPPSKFRSKNLREQKYPHLI